MVVSTQPEKRLLWHPRVSNRFAVGGGGQITLYELHPDHLETKIKHVTSQQELQLMKCFQWSPHPGFDDLMAIGLSNGKVDLLRLEATNAGSNNVYTSGPTVTLPLRNSRTCNALAFSQADPNYLAVGLDKVRSDCSLVIWDVSTAVPALMLPTRTNLMENVETFSGTTSPRLPRGDVGHRADIRMLQQYAPTEIVSSLTFLPSSTHLLFAGISHRWLRLFDLRASMTVNSVPTKAHAIATDPFDTFRLATIGDGTVSVWDRRKFASPIIAFSEREAIADGARIRHNATYSEVEFSSTRRGTLATLEKDATHVRFWDLLDIQPKAVTDDKIQSREPSRIRVPRKSWTNLPWVTSGPQIVASPTHESESSSVVLCNTRKTKSVSPPLASFALVPDNQTKPLASNVMMVTQTGALELYAVHDTPKQSSWSSRCDLLIGTGRSLRLLPGFKAGEPIPEPWESTEDPPSPRSRARSNHSRAPSISRGRVQSKGQVDDEEFPSLITDNKLHPNKIHTSRNVSGISKGSTLYHFDYSRGNDRRSRSATQKRESEDNNTFSARGLHTWKHPITSVQRVVEEDISNLMRARVIHGYGLGKNNLAALLETQVADPQTYELVDLWAWINYSREFLCEPTPLINGYDCSNQGLLGIWAGFEMRNFHPLPNTAAPPRSPGGELFDDNGLPVLTSHRKKRRGSGNHEPVNNFSIMLQTLIGRRNNEPVTWKPTIHTNKLLQRQVALQLCGWSLQEEELMTAIKRWEEEGKLSRAVCWLVFTKKYNKAIELLMKSKDEAHHLMSGTLAALIPSGASRNPELRDHCQRLIIRLQDPYFRAILTHLTSGDWADILEEESLPFRERLAIAFQFLDDKSVTNYLRTCVDKSCACGQVDILLVTGLTSKMGMTALQSYVDTTGDVQTAAILSSFVSPHKIPDRRADHWVEAYRDFLDGLKLFHHRVAFDIQRGQIIQESVLSGAGSVSCSWAELPSVLIRCNYCSKTVTLASNDPNKSTACPNCGKPLPRCAICLLSLAIVQDNVRNALLSQGRPKEPSEDAIVICQTCRHGGHASHILNWFYLDDGSKAHETCPVADCDCRCAD